MNEPTEHDIAGGQRRLGVTMVVAAWIAVLAVLTMLFGNVLERQHNPNQEVNSVRSAGGDPQVRLVQNRSGHYVATGFINEHPVIFLLDTGATEVSVPEGLARRLGLRRGPEGIASTANGQVTTYATVLDRVRLGDIALGRVRAHINPGMHGDEVLLGMSFLRGLDLNQRDGVLTVTQRATR